MLPSPAQPGLGYFLNPPAILIENRMRPGQGRQGLRKMSISAALQLAKEQRQDGRPQGDDLLISGVPRNLCAGGEQVGLFPPTRQQPLESFFQSQLLLRFGND